MSLPSVPLPPFSGAVLAGGRSTRMGTDKAFLEVDGRPLVSTVASVLEVAGADDVFVVGGDPTALERLGLRAVPDRLVGAGPLAGTETALATATHDHVVVSACDLPDLGPRTVVEVLAGLDHGPGRPDVAVPVVDGRRQYAFAAYRRSAAEVLRALLDEGERALHVAFDHLEVVEVVPSRPETLRDVDTPADLDGRS